MSSIAAELASWLENVRNLEKVLAEFWKSTPNLEQLVSSMSIGEDATAKDSTANGKVTESKKWFGTCFEQIFSSADGLNELLLNRFQ